ncbi:hypothetical protein E3P98_01145 [Wallemia ichthyophaga]|nr:hypothetical protein E3P98_01145 [Wallemia ichthyophaga]
MKAFGGVFALAVVAVVAIAIAQPNCSTAPTTTAPKSNPFLELSNSELADIAAWLKDPEQSLNLTDMDEAALDGNYIDSVGAIVGIVAQLTLPTQIELWHPTKEDAIYYLDQDGPLPDRIAKAHVVSGLDDPPIVKTLLVGPLPVSSDTRIENLAEKIYHNGEIPWNAKPSHPGEDRERTNVISETFTAISDALNDLLGVPWSLSNYDTGLLPNNGDGSYRHPWVELMLAYDTSAMWFAYTGLFAQFDFSNQDISQWKLRKLVYNNQKWSSTDAFNEDFNAGKLEPSPQLNSTNTNWALRSVKGTARDLEELPAPITYSPSGLRYRVDRDERYVTWMDWSFYLSYSPEQGLMLFDVKFKGERVAYEISLQDAVSNYGGADPMQAYTAYLDRGFGMATGITPLVRNYDCPHEATYMDVNFYDYGAGRILNDTICMFERDLQKPISRHYQSTDAGATRGVAFEVRSIYTVGNYDYLISFTLYPEGSIEIEVDASGYLQTTYYNPNGDSYDTRVSTTSSGSIHDHVITFKIDLDVAGESNSVERRDIVVSEDRFNWMDDDDPPLKQKKINTSVLEKEKEAVIDWNGNSDKFWLIGNKDSTNSYGYPRSYRLMPRSVIHNIVDGEKMDQNAKFADHHAFVTVTKDNERSCSSYYNAVLPKKPPVDFTKFYQDDESIRQKDLTLWASVGFRHVPRAEDVPNTLFIEAKSALMLSPFNYADEELSRDLRNSYYAVANEDYYLVADEHGINLDGTCSAPTLRPLGTLPY